jgi:phosphoribosylaminoimidazolecarboxamide formyltransferase/IMP cyclohydrolase
MPTIKRAILSVYDKTGIVELAAHLRSKGIHLLSTGGTSKELKIAGIAVEDISDYTGFNEILGGRVKTLHPFIHAGILAREIPEHLETLNNLGIGLIDLVVVNLYPFTQTVAKPDIIFEECIEMIDIGGPTMIRSAAKNFERVAVVSDPADYPDLMRCIDKDFIPYDKRYGWARKVFEHTSTYDTAIANFLISMERDMCK